MKKIKISNATPIQLDWLVAVSLGFTFNGKIWENGKGAYLLHDYSPTTNWAQGGPIIEREKIGMEPHPGTELWIAFIAAKQQSTVAGRRL